MTNIPQGQPAQCMWPGCPSPTNMERATHGLCRKCYKAVNKMVKANLTDWNTLVANGMAIPAIERSTAHTDNVAQVLREMGIAVPSKKAE
jgi:hypothetical protein